MQALEVEEYQTFEGSFTSPEDSAVYSFSIDFSQMDSAAVCLVRKGYIGTNIKVYDNDGNEILAKGTKKRQAKNWGFIEKPTSDATICNYTIIATPYSYEERASDYRIIIGDKSDTELMMSGIDNTVLLEQYYEEKVNLENSAYVPNVGEYWFKYTRYPISVITVLSDEDDIRFKVLEASTLNVEYDSAIHSDAHRTSFLGNAGGWIAAEKARLSNLVGAEHYLVVYCTNPHMSLSLREGSMATAVGNPVMCPTGSNIAPKTLVIATNSGYSSTKTFSVDTDDFPNTGQVESVYLNGTGMSNILRWRLMAPKQSYWLANPSNHHPSIDFGFVLDSPNNVPLKGTWGAAFQSSSSSFTFTSSYSIYYYYEYSD